jgi:hypothetical protein
MCSDAKEEVWPWPYLQCAVVCLQIVISTLKLQLLEFSLAGNDSDLPEPKDIFWCCFAYKCAAHEISKLESEKYKTNKY